MSCLGYDQQSTIFRLPQFSLIRLCINLSREPVLKLLELLQVICPIGNRKGLPHHITVWLWIRVLQTRVNDGYDPRVSKVADQSAHALLSFRHISGTMTFINALEDTNSLYVMIGSGTGNGSLQITRLDRLLPSILIPSQSSLMRMDCPFLCSL